MLASHSDTFGIVFPIRALPKVLLIHGIGMITCSYNFSTNSFLHAYFHSHIFPDFRLPSGLSSYIYRATKLSIKDSLPVELVLKI